MESRSDTTKRVEGELPLDVHHNKLIDWLVERKKLPADWRKRLAQVQARAASALRTLPPSVADVEDVEQPNFEAVSRLLEAFEAKGGAGAARNMLGRRTGVARELEVVLSTYKKHLLHWGEAAQALSQYIDYEVPFLRKQIAKCSQHLEDLSRKEADTERSITSCKLAFKEACTQMGIEGNNIRAELRILPSSLNQLFEDAVKEVRSQPMENALKSYREFVEYAHRPKGHDASSCADMLSAICSIQSAEESLTKGADDDLLLPAVAITTDKAGDRCTPKGSNAQAEPVTGTETEAFEATAVSDEIDWNVSAVNDGCAEDSAAVKINWDIDLADNTAAEIDWDICATEDKGEDSATPLEINWDFEMKDGQGEDATSPVVIDWDSGFEPIEVSSGSIQKDTEQRKSLPAQLMDPVYRNRLVEDLLEIQAFLRVRQNELSSGNLVMMNTSDVPAAIQQQSLPQVNEMGASVDHALNLLTNRNTRDLLLLQASGRYFDRVVSSLDAKKGQEVKLRRSLVDIDTKRQEILGQISTHAAREKALISRMRKLKQQLECDLRSNYKGRPVNIVGEINNLV
mmetsp:Transcript_23666/g.45072  ORF Transcript_23666/g.45072 Transcript_23666/m.45072 type:complete len:572 (+) Transcript_23666:89-1804(+)|eukprot:CAMPEP_0114293196 /NCGR_PEP_ID=MMETSP0059-20121206/9466_1 /TAXON_ID=36894 /ORGANISM="Pyramimonas parkeae, Strain CCMP726" /LENGTH=571 /DNA_ID=CAMNT_0001414895 /DNA_START=211 /DNA_END=1926 /DNA_ORIENTATION=+